MPQKTVFSRAPILQIKFCFPVNGTVRTKDLRIARLYQNAQRHISKPCLWEGLFRIACLFKSKPLDEPVAEMIRQGIEDTESGEIRGTIKEQINIARAALALFEYTADKQILKRLAVWLRYLEIEFDKITSEDNILYQPADLMEFLIRYYNVTGIKSVLRICSRLRAAAFDWTTALHTFQQSIPIKSGNHAYCFPVIHCKPEELEYDTKELLINHAEMLADGVRFTLFSGLFSGNSQDLSSGKTVWEYLIRHHRALCGGTTGNPYLCGCSPDQPVSNRALSAWTEALASQMVLTESDWAVDELVRIVFNGLMECLNHEEAEEIQRVNTFHQHSGNNEDTSLLYARLTRAAASAYNHAITITEEGIRINYLLEGKYLLSSGKKHYILNTESASAIFKCSEQFTAPVDFRFSLTDSSSVLMINGKNEFIRKRSINDPLTGFYIRSKNEWNDGDGFIIKPDGNIIHEDTHHQGICFFSSNCLMTIPAERSRYAFAVCGYPEKQDEKINISLSEIEKWPIRDGEPADIPVLPEGLKKTFHSEMIPYSDNFHRITMFPKAGNSCMK